MVDHSYPIQNLTSKFQCLARWALCAFCAIAYLTVTNGVNAADVGAKRVLIISTGSRLAPGFVIVDQQLLRVLGNIPSVRTEIYAENLDLVRFPSERYRQIFREYLADKYAAHRPDLVILVFVGTLGIPGKLLPELFPRTPIIVAGFTEEEIRTDQFGPLVSGLAQRVNPRATVELILRLQPALRRIVVVGGTAEIDRHVLQRVKEAAQSIKGRIEIDFWDNLTMAELRKAVTTVPRDTAILYARMFRDAAGQAFISSEVGQWIAQWANAPVYVMTDASFGTGAVGGSLASIEAFGKRAGELARLILTGTAPASLSFELRTDSVPTFDWRALKRWGIPANRLPPASVVRFRPRSLWEEYRWYVIGAFIIVCVQSAIIGDLLLHRRRRRRVEAALRENQQLMDLAASAGELGLWSRDLEQGEVWANSHLRTLFGFDQNQSLALDDLLASIHPDDRTRVTYDVESAQLAGMRFEGEFRVILRDGRVRWVVARGKTVSEARGMRRMGVVLDITERKRAEESLRESEERFRIMANTAPVMIWMSGTEKGCTFFNKGWLDFTGRTLEQELGNGWAEGVHRDDFDRCFGVYGRAFDARQEFSMEYRLRRYNGEYCWVLDTGVPRFAPDGTFLGYIGSAIDITERKRAEERFRLAVEASPSAIVMINPQGDIVLVNTLTERLFGYRREELLGKSVEILVPERFRADHPAHRAGFFAAPQSRAMGAGRDLFARRKDGTEFQVEIGLNPIQTSEGTLVLTAIVDITERKRAEAELRQNREELAHVTRISAMGELATSLAHELNQPLTAILSNAQAAQRFLSANPVDLEEVREILQDIVEDNNRASDVIRRMRALIRKEDLSFEPLDLARITSEVLSLVRSDAILLNVQVSFQCEDDLPNVRGDKVQLQQVVLNLLLNAFDAMKEYPIHERQVQLKIQSNGNNIVELSVRDRGTGLTTDQLDKIFEPFFTTKREGLGMGLSISRSIVEAHRGRLWAEKNPDRGAIFYFTLPVSSVSDDRSPIHPQSNVYNRTIP
jgi:two-component system, LuxR family, sensor kinase FixL